MDRYITITTNRLIAKLAKIKYKITHSHVTFAPTIIQYIYYNFQVQKKKKKRLCIDCLTTKSQ